MCFALDYAELKNEKKGPSLNDFEESPRLLGIMAIQSVTSMQRQRVGYPPHYRTALAFSSILCPLLPKNSAEVV
jgi:hypothetical protein